jgi:hypothetical protein
MRASFRILSRPTATASDPRKTTLLWLKNSSETGASVNILEANASATKGIALGQIFYGSSLAINYNDPTKDPRTPDIIVTPNAGVVYTGSTAKQSEHGGFGHDDTNVILLLSHSSFEPSTVRAQVGTVQVAPTILKALGVSIRRPSMRCAPRERAFFPRSNSTNPSA